MMGCIFCKIVQKQIPAKIVYEDEKVLAFEDSTPQAPVHILIIPKEHIPTVNDINESHKEILSALFAVAKKIAEENNIAQRGYRLVMNTNAEAGQSVFHIHLHILGGRHMAWPPG
ncbi:MAG: histidine triad nucleotide-binding protein [Candidatus Firestonebacteria bacterium RIFOXYA2_FULL_40_8]|nr:MAG: histidine triad nucleotide-binding protein [Candidatus Firestonebacteria bacterium RIFOXYA2_FULL_40_8]